MIPRLSGHRHKNNPPKWKVVFVSKFVLWFGRSDGTWTHGLLTPSQARYQLRHTPFICILLYRKENRMSNKKLGINSVAYSYVLWKGDSLGVATRIRNWWIAMIPPTKDTLCLLLLSITKSNKRNTPYLNWNPARSQPNRIQRSSFKRIIYWVM